MKDNYYEILEVSPKASKDVIDAVYKQLAKKYHPDLQQKIKRAGADEKMKEINLAYETLKDPLKRGKYDAFLMETRVPWTNKNSILEQIRKVVLPLTLLVGMMAIVGIDINNKSDYNLNVTEINATGNLRTPDENLSDVPEDRFTLGSSQGVVKKVMGVPTSMFLYSWSYGNSLIYFDKEGRVDGWVMIDETLKVWLGDIESDAPPINLGSTKGEVINAMGTPTAVIGDAWSYGESTVYFNDNGRVRNWIEAEKK